MVTSDVVRYADCDGLQIAYQLVGSGPVDLLYVPGSANHIEAMWDIPELARFVERLATFARVILMDKRGTGLSDPMPADHGETVEERMHDVSRFWTPLVPPRRFCSAQLTGAPLR